MKKEISITLSIVLLICIFFGSLIMPISAKGAFSSVVNENSTPSPLPTQETKEIAISVEDTDKIKEVIGSYFSLRYKGFNTLELNDFSNLVSDSKQAQEFLLRENEKLILEIKHAELNQLRFVEYDYWLEFSDFIVDDISTYVVVTVLESSEFIEEISVKLNPDNPFISHRYDLAHTIIMEENKGQWKIVDDIYNDYLWLLLKKTKQSPGNLVNLIAATQKNDLHNKDSKSEFSCNFGVDDSSHSYNREEAVAYANQHVDLDDYNTYYPSYYDPNPTPVSGDCTNFVSQAIYEGGNASLSIPDPLPSPDPGGQLGWYLLNGGQRATAWNDVENLYSFITGYAFSNEGPEGCDTTLSNTMLGDIIQYDWGGDSAWDHSVIIIDFTDSEPFVASHSPNDARHYTAFNLYVPGTSDIRAIHIERSDGYDPVKVFIAENSDDGGINPSTCSFSSSQNEVYLGNCTNGQDITSGFRFTDIDIPRNATINYAYITFSIDGQYTNNLDLKIYGEATGDSLTFSSLSPPHARATTSEGNAVVWGIRDTWELTDNINDRYSRTTPQLSALLQEIVDRVDWDSGNDLSIIIKNATVNNNLHRRVIAYERADWADELYSARLIVSYSITSVPTEMTNKVNATSTPTPSFTPSFAATNTPFATQTPSETATPVPSSLWQPAEKVLMSDESEEKSEAFSDLLSQVRDEIMAKSSKGDEYIKIVYNHAPEIMTILSKDEKLRLQMKDLALDVEPLLYAMVNDSTAEKDLYLEKDWIEDAINVMTIMQKQASPELQKDLDWWIAELPEFAGKTGLEIWESLP